MWRKIWEGLVQRLHRPELITSNEPTSWTTRPIAYFGHSQESLENAIVELQTILHDHDLLPQISGQFDAETEEAVKEFQQKNRLIPDGIVGPLTWAVLLYPVLSHENEPIPEREAIVKELQEILVKEGFQVKCDGHFGKSTHKALKQFQKECGLHSDGVCSPPTWVALKGQRYCHPKSGKSKSFILLERDDIEQFFMILAILLGIHFNPWGLEENLSLLQTVPMAYALTGFAPKLLEKLLNRYLIYSDFRLLRYSPYVLTGILWRPFLQFVRVAILK